MKKLHALTSIAAGVGLALIGSAANAGIFPQCPDEPGVMKTLNSSAGPTNAKVCGHLAAGDGWVLRADGGRYYTFGFSDMTNVSNDDVVLKGLFNAKWSAPTLAFREGQQVYLALSNVGLLLRPDLFDPHSVHWHGFPQAAPIYDGVPEASATVNTGSTFTYFYKVNDPGTYIYHCHVEASEHMQMGMLGNLYVTPKQDGQSCTHDAGPSCIHAKFAYNDGDGSTGYDVDFPIQIDGFDGPFHDLHDAVQPLPFRYAVDPHLPQRTRLSRHGGGRGVARGAGR